YFLTANPNEFVNPTNVGLLGTGIRQEVVRFVTNTFKAAFPITLQTASTTQPGLRRGVDKITFQRMVPDSTEGPAYVPVTNDFSDVIVTNGANSIQFVRRVITRPDILFRARDLGLLVGGGPVAVVRTTTSGWNNNSAIDGDAARAGPGMIPGQVTGATTPNQVFIDFNPVTPSYLNRTPDSLNEDTAFTFFNWGSFDGTTNAPIVYPVGTSIEALESLITGP
ncbi:MAG: hypothetical protein HYZ36_03610, partial [Pedosphaera parvula]|nr:hypothetical protein [Pedosphaera parvula]